MRRKVYSFAAVVAAVVAGLASASVVVGQEGNPPDSAGRGSDAPADSERNAAPASPPEVSASTRGPNGERVGIATYRNRNGRLCLAQGLVRADGRGLIGKGGRGLPYEQLGDCSIDDPDPVSVAVTSVGNDQTTPEDESKVIVSGVAGAGVDKLNVALGQRAASLEPGRNGAFIIAESQTRAPVTITATMDDGSTETVRLGPPLDLEKITEMADKHARSDRPESGHSQGNP